MNTDAIACCGLFVWKVLLLSFAFFVLPSIGPWFGSQHQMDHPAAPGLLSA